MAANDQGFSGKRAAEIVGITYRQLDYWARTDLIRPSLADAGGSGTRRRYSYTDLVELKVIKRLLDAGIKLESIRETTAQARLTAAFDAMRALYIADGHHRSASASRIAAARRAADSGHSGAEPYNFFLSVIFPAHEMRIMDYNRVIADLNGLSADAFLAKIAAAFDVEPAVAAVKPERPGVFGLYLAGKWYRLAIRPELVPADPVGRLDVSLLQNNLIAPVLGIADPRRDKRIDFVGGIRGLAELEKRVDSGEMALAFSLHPTRMEDLMAVADANEVMPPKSTWFEPKLADGLASHVLG